ncbi:MAG: hypothetical protein V4813_14575 [Gemmatimonadota bacterium]
MTTFRFRSLGAALLVAAASLSACANDPTAPLESESTSPVSATVDSTKRIPTVPWTSVAAIPTIPWASVQSAAPAASGN